MRPTGRLHIGHYFGALQNWIRLQDDPQYECFYFIADWHALTTDYADTSFVAQNTIEIGIDWLAAGLDPEKSTLFVQSQVPEHAELNLLLSMITPLGWLERVPTYKEALDNIKDKDLHTLGFLGYPVLQTADIVMYGEPDTDLVVPVGEDQKSHVELGREIVQRFNGYYGLEIREELFTEANKDDFEKLYYAFPNIKGQTGELFTSYYRRFFREHFLSHLRGEATHIGIQNFLEKAAEGKRFLRFQAVLQEPEAMLTHTPRIPGLDGRKMSKSYGNAIMLSESDDDIRKKTKVMITDPARKRRENPGNPDVCPVFDWHKLFSPKEVQDWSAHGCRTAGIGCIECKNSDGRSSDQMDRADPPAPPGFRERSAASPRISGHRLEARAPGGAANHGPRPRRRLPLERKARRTRPPRRGQECPSWPLAWSAGASLSF